MVKKVILFLFAFGSLSYSQTSSWVSDYDVQLEDFPDANFFPLTSGQVVATGLERIDGDRYPQVITLDSAGQVANQFENYFEGFSQRLVDVISLPDGGILVAQGVSPSAPLIRFGIDGARVPTFSPDLGLFAMVDDLALVEGGQVLVGGQFRIPQIRSVIKLTISGEIDTTFSSQFGGRASCIQADGNTHYLIGGGISYPGAPSPAPGVLLIRTDLTGNLDSGFVATGIPSSYLQANGSFKTNALSEIFRLPSGKILFLDAGGVGRLNADGRFDESFARPNTNGEIRNLARSPDGSFYLDGDFTEIDGISMKGTAKLSPEGILDPAFVTDQKGRLAPLADGSVLIWGAFSGYGGATKAGFAKIDATGQHQPGFEANYGRSGFVHQLSGFSDGSTLVIGDFMRVTSGGQTTMKPGIARLDANGVVDPSFSPPRDLGEVVEAMVLPSQKIIALFSSGQSTPSFQWERLLTNGALDPTFPESHRNALVNLVAPLDLLPNGVISFYQDFTEGTIRRYRKASLLPDGIVKEEDEIVDSLPPNSSVPDGNGYRYWSSGTYSQRSLQRHLPSGLLDPSFQLRAGDPSIFAEFTNLAILPGLNFLLVGEAGLPPAMIDLNGHPNPNFNPGVGADREITGVWAFPEDGLIFLSGPFNQYQSVDRAGMAQVRFDGSLEEQFDLSQELLVLPTSMRKLANGDILVGGGFSSLSDLEDPVGLAVIRPVSQATPAIPTAPEQVSAAADLANRLKLSWRSPADADSILIQRQLLPDGAWRPLASLPASTTTYTDLVFPSSTYRYRITAFNPAGERTTEIQVESPPEENLVGQIDPSQIDLLSHPRIDVVQPLSSGKMLVVGRLNWVAGQHLDQSTSMVRLNPDGSLDSAFEVDASISSVRTIVEQADGRILIGMESQDGAILIRLLADGTTDPEFVPFQGAEPGDPQRRDELRAVKVLSDGRILVGGDFGSFVTNDPLTDQAASCLILTSQGEVDRSPFPLAERSKVSGQVNRFVELSNGQIMVAGGRGLFFAGYLRRLNSNGQFDSAFSLEGQFDSDSTINGVHEFSDGSLLLAGDFSRWTTGINAQGQIDFTELGNLAIVKPDGTLDEAATALFGEGADDEISKVLSLPDGRVFFVGEFTEIGGVPRQHLATIQANGSLAPSTLSISPNAAIRSLAGTADGGILIAGFYEEIEGQARYGISLLEGPSGPVSQSFSPQIFTGGNGAAGSAVLNDSSGNLLVAGSFDGVGINGVFYPSKKIARLLPDGSVDSGFSPPFLSGEVLAMALNSVDEILIGGSFMTAPGAAQSNLAKLSPNGALDLFFEEGDKPTNRVTTLVVDSNDRIYAGGDFVIFDDDFNFTSQVARFESDGSWDSSFKILPPLATTQANALALQQDRLFVVYRLTSGFDSDLVAVDVNGTVDLSLTDQFADNPTAIRSFGTDGLLLGEGITGPGSNFVRGLSAYNLSVSPETLWESPLTRPSTVKGFSNELGEALVFGDLYLNSRQSSLIRIIPEIGLDPTFRPVAPGIDIAGASRWGNRIAIVGSFTKWEGAPRMGLVLLGDSSDPPADPTISVTAAGASNLIRWESGTGIHPVKIEGRKEGSDSWEALGFAGSTEDSFLFSQPSADEAFEFRVTSVSFFDTEGASSEIKSPIVSTFAIWLAENGLSLSINHENDDDRDGIPLLLEYAFDLNPGKFSLFPEVFLQGGSLSLEVPSPRPDIIYALRVSPDLESWQTIPLESQNLANQRTFSFQHSATGERIQFFGFSGQLRPE